jgi:hypothetical protein
MSYWSLDEEAVTAFVPPKERPEPTHILWESRTKSGEMVEADTQKPLRRSTDPPIVTDLTKASLLRAQSRSALAGADADEQEGRQIPMPRQKPCTSFPAVHESGTGTYSPW